MKIDLNTHASSSALAKLLGVPYDQIKVIKELLNNSDLASINKSYVLKNKTVEYQAYDIREALDYIYNNIEGNHVQNIAIDINEELKRP